MLQPEMLPFVGAYSLNFGEIFNRLWDMK
jgi:hypothetical protein